MGELSHNCVDKNSGYLSKSGIERLTPLDFLEVKWLNSLIFMSYEVART